MPVWTPDQAGIHNGLIGSRPSACNTIGLDFRLSSEVSALIPAMMPQFKMRPVSGTLLPFEMITVKCLSNVGKSSCSAPGAPITIATGVEIENHRNIISPDPDFDTGKTACHDQQ